jgi:anti-sigma factor RsiW
MSSSPNPNRCEQSEATCAYALQVLPASEAAAAEAHIASCPDCQRELESLRPVVDRFVSWPTDVLRPPASLQGRLALRIAEDTGNSRCRPRRDSGPSRAGNRSRLESNASCSRATRNDTGSACWYASRPARAIPRILMQAWKSCISSTVSCGSTGASLFRATTTTVRPEPATRVSGARPAAPACSLPVPEIPFAKALGA